MGRMGREFLNPMSSIKHPELIEYSGITAREKKNLQLRQLFRILNLISDK
jgi:hypothetical protein